MSKVQVQSDHPFHETIVDAIQEATSTELHCLARLIKRTTILKDHDRIIAAWEERCKSVFGPEDLGVPATVRAKKEKALSRIND